MKQIRKVLIVDDDQQLASVIQMALETEGYEAITALTAGHGYFDYLCYRPDLVITDIQMPEISGLELMRHIRVHDPWIRTIYMSGELDFYRPLLEGEKQCYRVNMLEKPFSKADLMRLLCE